MAGRADILAGQAYVRLALEDKQYQGAIGKARYALDGLTSFGKSIASAFAPLAAVGAAVGGAMASAVASFVSTGSELNDMAARTGASSEQLQHWTYAAKQTGASASDLETALRKAAKNGVGPGEFERVGKEIAGISDPAERSARAMEMFGKSGTKLLPMFQDLNSLKAQSQALGPLLDDEQVKAADALGDAFGALIETVKRMVGQIGAALGPHLIGPLQTAIGLITSLHDAVSGKGTQFSGDLLDRLAQFRQTSFADFQKRGAFATASFSGMKARAGDEDEGEAGSNGKAAKQLDMQRSLQRAEQRRLSLINEFATAEERHKAKLDEINQALIEVNRNRVLGTLSPQQAEFEKHSLEVAKQRAIFAERERLAKQAAKPQPAKKLERPEVPREAEDIVRRSKEIQTIVGFNGNALAMGAQMGGAGPAEKQLKAAEAALKKYDRMIAELEKLNHKPAFGVAA